MPPLLPVEGVARLTLHHTLDSRSVLNTIHIWKGNTSAWTQGDLDTVVNAAYTAWSSNVMTILSHNMAFTSAVLQDLSSTGFGSSTHTGSSTGGDINNADAMNVACCVSLHEPNRYRGGHPRMYLGGTPVTARADQRTWTSTFQSNAQAKVNAFLTAITGIAVSGSGSTVPGTVHRHLHKAVLNPPLFYSTFTCSVDSRIDSQRRRLGKP